jgi:AcrR family transcriptional regulator
MSRDIQEKIYESGKKLFNAYGPKKVSIDVIVKEAWVGKGSFYNYYENKEDLYEEIFDNIMNFAADYMDKLVETYPDPKERFVMDLLNSLDFFCEDTGIIGSLMNKNKDYFFWNVNESRLEKVHSNMLRSLFRDVHEEIFGDSQELMVLTGHIFWYYKHAQVMKKQFPSDEKFRDFMTKFAVFLVNWVFNPEFSTLKKIRYSDYKDDKLLK